MDVDASVASKWGWRGGMGAIRDAEFAGWRKAAPAYEAYFAAATRPYTGALLEARRLHGVVDFHQGDAEHLPFKDSTFDAAVSNFGIHHCERLQQAIAEAHRVVRPGGRVAVTL